MVWWRAVMVVLLLGVVARGGEAPGRDPFSPRGKAHIPIGLANANDRLKTFVEPEGCFSPGFASYGIYFWTTDPATGKLVAPTMDGVKVEYGLSPAGLPTPWSTWSAGAIRVRSELRQARWGQQCQMVLAQVQLTNTAATPATTRFVVALRPMGPAGYAVKELHKTGAMLRSGVGTLVAPFSEPYPDQAIVLPTDTIADVAGRRELPDDDAAPTEAKSPAGDCSGALVYELKIEPGKTRTVKLVFPVLAGRRVLPHQWDGVSTWAQFDLAPLDSDKVGEQQVDEGACFMAIDFDEMWAGVEKYWGDLAKKAKLQLPDPRWSQALSAMTAHAALCMNDGAPDVSVVNYNVFNRDGVYVTNILQKAGRLDLAEKCIDYFLAHPFNGRVQPEADNPGQILWILGQHWLFSRDPKWLARVYPSAVKIVRMIRYYRTAPEPHWVWDTSLDFGDALPADRRKRLKPGACDGHHPEYTEAFDIAGLRAAAMLAKAMDRADDARTFSALAEDLFARYHERFGKDLRKGYGSYCVLWPCGLHNLSVAANHDGAQIATQPPIGNRKSAIGNLSTQDFTKIGPQKPSGWRYFPLATAHQGVLAGNRDAACKTIAMHLDHEQMKGFYAFDEGGKSGAGAWKDPRGKPRLRTTWNGDVAMPHGWAIAELHLLIRDSLVFEEGDRLVVLAGVPADWFGKPMKIEQLPTQFGLMTLECTPGATSVRITIQGVTSPGGVVVRTAQGDLKVENGAVEVPR